MNIFLVFLILGVLFLGYKKINSKKTKNLKLEKFKNKLQSAQTNIDRIFLREEEKTFSNPNINIYIGVYEKEENIIVFFLFTVFLVFKSLKTLSKIFSYGILKKEILTTKSNLGVDIQIKIK